MITNNEKKIVKRPMSAMDDRMKIITPLWIPCFAKRNAENRATIRQPALAAGPGDVGLR
jgi:hypothetical protein